MSYVPLDDIQQGAIGGLEGFQIRGRDLVQHPSSAGQDDVHQWILGPQAREPDIVVADRQDSPARTMPLQERWDAMQQGLDGVTAPAGVEGPGSRPSGAGRQARCHEVEVASTRRPKGDAVSGEEDRAG
jgi:hypothetical protein